MTDAKLPAWPEKIAGYEAHPDHVWISAYPRESHEILAYERARAEAAIQRLRIAVEALTVIKSGSDRPDSDYWAIYDVHKHATEALALIGDLPPPDTP
jgi:hypothetical protein